MIWIVIFPLWAMFLVLLFVLVAPFPIVQRTAQFFRLVNRKKCEGYDDPEERCPRKPKDCICWQGREKGV